MARWLVMLAAVTALAGCYNPRYPSEVPGAEAVPHETGNSQETSVRERDRRNAAAASGSSTTGY
jgi:predicted small lipoprotein YifL